MKKQNISKSEYRDRYYLVIGLSIGGIFSLLGGLVSSLFVDLLPSESKILIFWLAFFGFWLVFIAIMALIFHLGKKAGRE